MHLDQDIHAKAVCCVFKLGGLSVFEGCHDQKDAIGTQRPGFGHLIGVKHEILAQDRQVNGGTCRDQIAVIALEIGDVGQDRQATCPTGLIGLC